MKDELKRCAIKITLVEWGDRQPEGYAFRARNAKAHRMDAHKTTLERAFELAKSGRYATSGEIKQVLNREGYAASQITGPMLMRQLREILAASRETPEASNN